jgi:hypothetical protein
MISGVHSEKEQYAIFSEDSIIDLILTPLNVFCYIT